MERGVLMSGARCGTKHLERDGPVSNGFGATNHGTCRYTISIPLERLPEVVLEQVGFQLYRKHIAGVSKSNFPVANLELLVAKSKFEVRLQFCLNILSLIWVYPSRSSICTVFFFLSKVYLFDINAFVPSFFLESLFIYLFDSNA